MFTQTNIWNEPQRGSHYSHNSIFNEQFLSALHSKFSNLSLSWGQKYPRFAESILTRHLRYLRYSVRTSYCFHWRSSTFYLISFSSTAARVVPLRCEKIITELPRINSFFSDPPIFNAFLTHFYLGKPLTKKNRTFFETMLFLWFKQPNFQH